MLTRNQGIRVDGCSIVEAMRLVRMELEYKNPNAKRDATRRLSENNWRMCFSHTSAQRRWDKWRRT